MRNNSLIMCTKLLLVIVSRLVTKCIMQMLFRCEISKFKIMPQSNVYKNIFTSSWTCCKPPKCKDLVVTQLAWDQALKWSGVSKASLMLSIHYWSDQWQLTSEWWQKNTRVHANVIEADAFKCKKTYLIGLIT